MYLWVRFYAIFKNINGLKTFAERCQNWLIRTTTRVSLNYNQKNERLTVEKENLLRKKEEVERKAMIEYDDFFGIRKKVRTLSFLFWIIIIAEGFLNYISTLIFIPGDGFSFTLLRWFIAIVLTGSGIIAAEKFLDSLFPVVPYKGVASKQRSIPIATMWGVLLLIVEIAIVGVAEARARDIEGGTDSQILYYGFILLSMVLPVVAGATRWDLMHYIDAYQNTLLHNKIEKRLLKIDSILRKNVERDSLYYKLKSTAYWDLFNEFKVRKENYNSKKGITEDLAGHYSENYDTFQKEADKRYEEDIRDRGAFRMSKLILDDNGTGNKLGQRSFKLEES